jgi:hypothetical protein
MKRGIPFLIFLICLIVGSGAGFYWRNPPAGILLGFGCGLLWMGFLRFFEPSPRGKKNSTGKEVAREE